MTTETAASGEVGLGRGGRMSRKRKRDVVLRLLRGEDLETLSRALGDPFQRELAFLSTESSPAFVQAPKAMAVRSASFEP